MNRGLRPFLTRRTARALLALLAVWLLLPAASSRAGCVYSHGATTGGVAHLDMLALTGALMPADAGRGPSLPISPCAGLRCSSDPAPPAPSVPLAPPRADFWSWAAALTDATTARPPFAFGLAAGEPVLHPSHHALPLLRPPR
jgi:hypothetical protein